MGKAAMCIQMLQILNTGKIYKVSELADLLETNPRNVIEYKKELEEAGYYVIGVAGKYGGYRLDQTETIPSLKFTDEEKKAVSEGAGYLRARNDFLPKKAFQTAIAKVYSSVRQNEPQSDPLVLNRFPLAMQGEEILARYNAVEKCVLRQFKMRMSYLSISNEVSERVIHPYRIYMYNNAWYVIGFDENTNEFRYFKLNRIQSFEVLSGQRFRRLHSYNEAEFFDEFGMKQNGEWYTIRLKLTGNYAMLAKERIYGKDQTVEAVDEKTTILSCKMQNRDMVLHFVLGFGADCEVLEPQWVRDEVAKTAKVFLERYGK